MAVNYDPLRKVVCAGHQSDIKLDNDGIGWLLFDSMKKWANEERIAQVDAQSTYEDTFKKLLSRCIRAAITMRQMGIQENDIITICSNNHINSVVPLIASYFIGAVVAPTDPALCINDTKHLLKLVKPKLIFASAECEKLIENCLKIIDKNCKIITFARQSNKFQTFESFLIPREEEDSFTPQYCKNNADTCLILFSSGTTGLPKGISLSHKFVMQAANGIAAIKNSGSTFLGYASLYWISTMMIVTTCLIMGYKRLLCLSFEPKFIWEYIDKFNVTFLFIAPVQAIQTIPHLYEKGTSLKYMMIAGGPIAPNYLQTLRNKLPETFVINSYGQTEIGCIAALKERDKNYEKLSTCGQPVSGLQIKIVDPDTNEVLGLNMEGEIRIKPDCPINGYFGQESSHVWDSDGFMKTGDMGYFDDDLCLFVTDRVKEMFKFMSFHVVPSKIEMILQSHPAVELAIVLGVPHPTEDNHAMGIVSLWRDARASGKELELYVEERVDDRNRLRAGVLIIEPGAFPMTPTGKIKRRELKDIIMKQRIRA